jgi:hypothetical protein
MNKRFEASGNNWLSGEPKKVDDWIAEALKPTKEPAAVPVSASPVGAPPQPAAGAGAPALVAVTSPLSWTRPEFFNIDRAYDAAKPLPAQITDAIEVLLDCENPVGLLVLNGSRRKVEPAIRNVRVAVSMLCEAIAQAATENATATRVGHVSSVERRARALDWGLKISAREKAVLVSASQLHELAISVALDEHREYVERMERTLWGLFTGGDPALISSLRDAGVIVWEGRVDHLLRIVTPNWLKTSEAIFRFVQNNPLSGRCCRLCGLIEPSNSVELESVTESRPGTFTGRGIPVLLHACCIDTWHDWRSIADRCASVAEAVAADREAGLEREVISMPIGGWRAFAPHKAREFLGAA